MSDTFPIKTPDPVALAQWAGLARTLIAALAGAGLLGAAWAAVSVEQITNILTAVLTLAGVAGAAWSAYKSWQDKRLARVKEVAAAKASAELGSPVTVTVTPEGMPNIATRISAAEQAAAPSVPVDVRPSPAPRPTA